jgi:hypothetical protein
MAVTVELASRCRSGFYRRSWRVARSTLVLVGEIAGRRWLRGRTGISHRRSSSATKPPFTMANPLSIVITGEILFLSFHSHPPRSVATLGSVLRAWGDKEFVTGVRHRHRTAALCGPHTRRINPRGKEVALGLVWKPTFPGSGLFPSRTGHE